MLAGILCSAEGPTERAMLKGEVGGFGHTVSRCPIPPPTPVLTITAGSAALYIMTYILSDWGHMLCLLRACGSAWFLHSSRGLGPIMAEPEDIIMSHCSLRIP